ncbi:hypothetical protein BV898_13305 [Hypsibius exemplaris]|uniref:Receptor ligand binding region domain-containing protein n=1 Tax=Hypsibius exemplaris TaxID=2072580 RepID=A0A1W0WB39_HYPEX|nr:hypothetical protein BV898_13305 [Hypsibius exemplaris]
MERSSSFKGTTVLLVVICNFIRPATAQDIELIVSLPSIPHWMADSQWIGPAFDIAAERVKHRFGSRASRIRATYLGDETAANCNDFSAQSARRISEYYFKNASISTPGTCYALITSPCNDDTGISSLAKEFDWPSFDMLPATERRSATVTNAEFACQRNSHFRGNLGLQPDSTGDPAGFGWYHATILTEVKPGFCPFYTHLESSLVEMSHIIKMEKRITMTQRMISTANRLTIQDGLSFAKTKSRVVIILAPVGSVIRILKETPFVGMSDGDFVFLNVQLEGRSEGPSGRLANLDNIEFQEFPVFRSLLMLTYYPTGQELMHLNEEIETRAQTAYHSVYPKNTKPLDNVPVRAAYDIVELLAAVLYASRSAENSSRVTAENRSTENPCSGLKFAKATTNRSFALSTELAFVDSNRIRNIDLDIFAFNTTLRSMTSVGSYDWTKHAILWSKNYSIDWPTVGGTPPLDVPACGYSGLEGLCAAAALRQTIAAVASSVSVLLVLGITLAGWKLLTKKVEWFLLQATDLTMI